MSEFVAKITQWFTRSETKSTTHQTDVARNESAMPQPVSYTGSTAVDGKISIRDGKIQITDPRDSGAFPVLVIPAHPQCTVTIDHRPATGPCIVSSSNLIEVQFRNRAPEVSYAISVSDDRLSVSVEAHVVPGVRYRLEDAEPSRKVILRVLEEVVPPPVNAAAARHIEQMLLEQGFHGAMDREALEALGQVTTSCAKVVLRGTPPTAGRPMQYRRVNLTSEVDPYTGREQLPTVSEGAVVAVCVPEIRGVPGRDVYGQEVPAPTVTSNVSLGPGVALVNGHVVAVRPGRVKFTANRIDVTPEWVIHRDVTVKDGRIVFHGNVVVKGNVLDGSYIRANGTVTVIGNVYGATIIGEQGIHVTGNLVGSNVWSGFTPWMYGEFKVLLTKLHHHLQAFLDDYKLMLAHAMQRSNSKDLIPKISGALFEKRHPYLGQLLQSIVSDCSPELLDIDKDYAELVEWIRTKWLGVQRTQIGLGDILHLQQRIQKYLENMQVALTEQPSPAFVRSVTRSMLRATGDIQIAVGLYWSHVESGGSIRIHGYVRGGFMVAEQSIHANELGAPGGTETSVRVNSADYGITADVCHPNTVLDVAGRRHRYLLTEQNVNYRGEPS
ncbi:FapA family protein [Alicyclobacillus contaminans]|uniref:FapA family protein n=1 Tax=Alicyclobacillus contaminans TaxID=392016 RepID=UPI000423FBC8|nr:FapA family protein [Alicyclobacillus contaminans]